MRAIRLGLMNSCPPAPIYASGVLLPREIELLGIGVRCLLHSYVRARPAAPHPQCVARRGSDGGDHRRAEALRGARVTTVPESTSSGHASSSASAITAANLPVPMQRPFGRRQVARQGAIAVSNRLRAPDGRASRPSSRRQPHHSAAAGRSERVAWAASSACVTIAIVCNKLDGLTLNESMPRPARKRAISG